MSSFRRLLSTLAVIGMLLQLWHVPEVVAWNGRVQKTVNDPSGTGRQLFTYDAYGNLLPVAGQLPEALTTLLYSGELTDATTGLQYLRARFYDPTTGRFTRLDPFAGNVNDPVSLHKYLYTHGNPIAFKDPTGRGLFVQTLTSVGIQALIVGLTVPTISGVSSKLAGGSFLHGAWRGTTTGLAMSLIAAKSKGVFTPAFGEAVVQVVAAGTFGLILETVSYWTENGGDIPAAKDMDEWFWVSANAAAIGLATKSFFETSTPRDAAALAFGSSLVTKGLPVVTNVTVNLFSSNSVDWGKVGSEFGEVLFDSGWTAAKTYATALINDTYNFNQLDPVSKQAIATALWGGWKVTIDNIKRQF